MSNFVPQLAAEAPNPTEYIAHHLTFLTNHKPHGLLDLSVVNFDSVFFSILLAVVFGGTFIFAARCWFRKWMNRSGASSRAMTD
jgi:F0F1-type ATP synthase membrane subunit a